jgi:hypothetical protein
VDEGAPGALPQAPSNESVFDFKKQDVTADASLGRQTFTTGRQLVGLKKL